MEGETLEVRRVRCDQVNALIRVIAEHGRHFFQYPERVSRMEIDNRGVIWFIDGYSAKRIYTAYSGQWRGFTQGGTLRDVVVQLRDYIRTGDPIWAGVFGPWPEWLCGGDLWGYGSDMRHVRDALVLLDIPSYDHTERKARTKHVCGLQGFGLQADDTCTACIQSATHTGVANG